MLATLATNAQTHADVVTFAVLLAVVWLYLVYNIVEGGK